MIHSQVFWDGSDEEEKFEMKRNETFLSIRTGKNKIK
jgi:hypothetical protein